MFEVNLGLDYVGSVDKCLVLVDYVNDYDEFIIMGVIVNEGDVFDFYKFVEYYGCWFCEIWGLKYVVMMVMLMVLL